MTATTFRDRFKVLAMTITLPRLRNGLAVLALILAVATFLVPAGDRRFCGIAAVACFAAAAAVELACILIGAWVVARIEARHRRRR